MEVTMEKIVALAKNRGFVYPGSEIYGGLANTWDYGPIGVELKNNVKKAWWRKFIQESPYNVGVDCAILMNPQTWVASGHVGGFSDPLMDCKECKERFRADKIIEEYRKEKGMEEVSIDAWSNEEMKKFIEEQRLLLSSFVDTLSASIDARDKITAGHSKRVTLYTMLICDKLNLDSREKEIIRQASLLHDIGKIGIRDSVLQKEGKLTEDEYKHIQQHVRITDDILSKIYFSKDYKDVAKIASSHHEKYNGSGYFRKL